MHYGANVVGKKIAFEQSLLYILTDHFFLKISINHFSYILIQINFLHLCGRSGWSCDRLTNSEVLPLPLRKHRHQYMAYIGADVSKLRLNLFIALVRMSCKLRETRSFGYHKFLKNMYILVITRAEEITVVNSLSLRVQSEDKDYFRHNIRGNTLLSILFPTYRFQFIQCIQIYPKAICLIMTHTALTPMDM